MNIRSYVQILWRRLWVILLTTAVAIAAAVAGAYALPTKYTATVSLWIPTVASGAVDYLGHDTTYSDRLMNTYSKLATSRAFTQVLQQQNGLAEPPRVTAETPANTEILLLTVEDFEPQRAADMANALADMLIARVAQQDEQAQIDAQQVLADKVQQAQDDLDQLRRDLAGQPAPPPGTSNDTNAAQQALRQKQQVLTLLLDQYNRARAAEAIRQSTISVIDPAVAPTSPISPQKKLILIVGAMLGLVGGVGLIFLFEHLDTRLYTSKQIEAATNLTLIGMIPAANNKRRRLVYTAGSPQEEAFQRLQSNLLLTPHGKAFRTLLVTSAEPNEGKSTVVANLATAIAQCAYTAVIVDCDLRLPTQHLIFNLQNDVGLTSILSSEASIDAAIQHTSHRGVDVITSGPASANPATLLRSKTLNTLVAELARRYDIVLLDSPSLIAVPDATALAPIVDGVILVVARAQVQRDAIQNANEQLEHLNSRPLGVVVNRAEKNAAYKYYR